MNRKQLRGFYKSFKSDMSDEGRTKSAVRRQVFGSFGKGLKNHFDKKGKGL